MLAVERSGNLGPHNWPGLARLLLPNGDIDGHVRAGAICLPPRRATAASFIDQRRTSLTQCNLWTGG